MPIYTITRRLISVARSYAIHDESGTLAFRLIGKLRFARTFDVRSTSEAVVVRVREKLLSIDPTYILTRDGTDAATVRRRTTTGAVVDKFAITLPDGAMEATGKLWADDGVAVKRAGSVVVTVRRVEFALRETFQVETVTTMDQALLLAMAMAIVDIDPQRGAT